MRNTFWAPLENWRSLSDILWFLCAAFLIREWEWAGCWCSARSGGRARFAKGSNVGFTIFDQIRFGSDYYNPFYMSNRWYDIHWIPTRYSSHRLTASLQITSPSPKCIAFLASIVMQVGGGSKKELKPWFLKLYVTRWSNGFLYVVKYFANNRRFQAKSTKN